MVFVGRNCLVLLILLQLCVVCKASDGHIVQLLLCVIAGTVLSRYVLPCRPSVMCTEEYKTLRASCLVSHNTHAGCTKLGKFYLLCISLKPVMLHTACVFVCLKRCT